jgi:apolipoprotein N-acyltransferase
MMTGIPDLQRWYDHHPRVVSLGMFACGAPLTLAFAPFGLYLLVPFLIVPLLLSALCLKPMSAARTAFWFGFGFFLSGTYWIYVSVHVIGMAPLWIAIPLMLGLVFIMAMFFASMGWLMSRLVNGDPLRLVWIGPAAWVLIEWLRGWFLSGFPWLSLGYSQIDSALAGWAPLLGIYGVSVLSMVSMTGIVLLLVRRHRALALALLLFPWLLGQGLRTLQWTQPIGNLVATTLVQGGVPQEKKWLPEQFAPTLELYHNALINVDESTLIVWPEVAIPSLINLDNPYLAVLEDEMRAQGKTLVLGILEHDSEEQRIYNSVLLLDGNTRQVYRKRHLVPFGEYFPVPDFVREWMRLLSLPNNDISAGAATQPVLVAADGTKMGVAICYEDAYGAEQLYALPDATIMINVSNDGWFGSSIAPHQHLQIARMRALEAGRWVVRATNNGLSAFIDPQGEIIAMAPQFEFATLSADIQPRSGLTPYAWTGNWSVILPLFLILAWAGYRREHNL